MYKHYELNKRALEILICNKISLTDSNNKIKLIIYYPKFNTANLIIYDNFSPHISYLCMAIIGYQFNCPFREHFSYKESTYLGLTTTAISRYLPVHLSDSSSISQHLKIFLCPFSK